MTRTSGGAQLHRGPLEWDPYAVDFPGFMVVVGVTDPLPAPSPQGAVTQQVCVCKESLGRFLVPFRGMRRHLKLPPRVKNS